MSETTNTTFERAAQVAGEGSRTQLDELGLQLEVDRGPECLFVKVRKGETVDQADLDRFSELIWSLLSQHLTYRLVLDLGEVELLHSLLIGQLIALRKKVVQHQGVLRLCGLSQANQKVLHVHKLESHLPHYPTARAAIMR